MSRVQILDEPVLTLNASYEPLHVCNTRRALGLVLGGNAEIVLNGRGVIHSASGEYELPSVIRLGYQISRPRPRVNLTRREILKRDGHTCQYCGRKMGELTIDHIVPRRLGGTHRWDNVVAACKPCNRRKAGHLLSKVNMNLLRRPLEPSSSVEYRFGNYLATCSEWGTFLSGW